MHVRRREHIRPPQLSAYAMLLGKGAQIVLGAGNDLLGHQGSRSLDFWPVGYGHGSRSLLPP